jgi:hypothetical protein
LPALQQLFADRIDHDCTSILQHCAPGVVRVFAADA